MIADRILALVADRRNVAGLLGACAGLGLTFGHVVQGGWLAITGGLYVAGFVAAQLLAPPPDPTTALERTPAAQLPDALKRLAARVGPDLPAAARKQLDAIVASAISIEQRLAEMDSGGVDPTPIRQVLAHYVPDTLRAYERVPPALRARPDSTSGRSPDDQIAEQLKLLAEQLTKLIETMARGDLDAIEAQGRFLKARFSTADPLASL